MTGGVIPFEDGGMVDSVCGPQQVGPSPSPNRRIRHSKPSNRNELQLLRRDQVEDLDLLELVGHGVVLVDECWHRQCRAIESAANHSR
jgi:hypothetical protein